MGKKCSKSFPKPSQNSPQTLPKWIKNRARRPLGNHLGPMLEKNSILNAPKTAKRRPRAPERGPKASQPLPKWSPRPSQIQFLCDFFALYLPIPNLHWVFINIVTIFCRFFKPRTLKISVSPAREHDFHKIGFFKKKHRKRSPQASPNLPKTSKNPFKFDKNRQKLC